MQGMSSGDRRCVAAIRRAGLLKPGLPTSGLLSLGLLCAGLSLVGLLVFGLAGPFDMIVANILARPLMQLAPQMARHVTIGGSLILSGILERQRDAVLAAYSGQRFRHVLTLPREGWVTLHLKR